MYVDVHTLELLHVSCLSNFYRNRTPRELMRIQEASCKRSHMLKKLDAFNQVTKS